MLKLVGLIGKASLFTFISSPDTSIIGIGTYLRQCTPPSSSRRPWSTQDGKKPTGRGLTAPSKKKSRKPRSRKWLSRSRSNKIYNPVDIYSVYSIVFVRLSVWNSDITPAFWPRRADRFLLFLLVQAVTLDRKSVLVFKPDFRFDDRWWRNDRLKRQDNQRRCDGDDVGENVDHDLSAFP